MAVISSSFFSGAAGVRRLTRVEKAFDRTSLSVLFVVVVVGCYFGDAWE